jgi:hypothetical protein
MPLSETLIQEMIINCKNHKHDLQSKHISVILLNGIPITKFHYNYRRCKIMGIYTGTSHAEICAIKQLFTIMNLYYIDYINPSSCSSHNKTIKIIKRKISRYSILVLRVNNKGQLLNSKPCLHCLGILKLYGLNKIYYSNNNGIITEEKIKNMDTNHLSRINKTSFKSHVLFS